MSRDGLAAEPALVELVEEVRTLVERVRTADAPAGVLHQASATVREAARLLVPHGHPGPYQQAGLVQPAGAAALGGEDDPGEFFPYSPVAGPRNPLAPPARLWREGDRLVGEVVFGAAYAGPPSTVHGGMIALLFDELLGATGVVLEVGGFTGTLSVRYERPTPLGAKLTMAGWLDRVEGRKAYLVGELVHGDRVTARAEGVFIASAGEGAGS